MRFLASEVARAVGGSLSGPEVEVDGATIDSRSAAPGQLFVPVVAERDGHDFITAALAAGAAATLTSRPPREGITSVVVDDTADALTRLGRVARHRLPDLVVGITGSVGKTSTKDMAAATLATRFTVAASERSFNNELGVPLTLVNAPEGTDATVVEMGARGRGHIAWLCEIARPTIAVVTAVALVHAELMGDLEGIARAKAELPEALGPDGVAVLNAADPRVMAMARRTPARVVRFGPGGEVQATDVEVDSELRARFVLESDWGSAKVHLGVRGEHQVANALAAAAVALVSGAPVEGVATALEAGSISPWRMDLQTTESGARVLNDAYNAGPTSMEAALRSLAQLPAGRRLAVLGPMAELGPHGPAEHRRIAELAGELGIAVVAVGTDEYGVEPVAGISAAADAVGPLGPDDAVLVKGSRVAGLEALAEDLLTR